MEIKMNVSKLVVGLVVASFSLVSFAQDSSADGSKKLTMKEKAALHHMKKNKDERMGRRASRHHKEAALYHKNQGSKIEDRNAQ